MTRSNVLRGLTAQRGSSHPTVVTVGVFDGVHRAHQQLIRSTVHIARRLGGTSVAVTFDPDPQVVLDPRHAQPALMPLDARVRRLNDLGIDRVQVIPFTKRFARMSAQAFIERVLIRRLHTQVLVVGEQFAFGRDRRGNTGVLQTMGSRYGMRVVSIPSVIGAGRTISSSRIRHLIDQGRLSQARYLLGRPPELYGVVVRGAGRGRQLGFPTANLRLTSQILPPRGVFAVLIGTTDGRRSWRGVMNLGVRPTFGPGPLVCEVHLLGFSGTLVGRSVCVSLLARLRGERCFPSPGVLCRQVRHDLRRARRLFARFP